MLETKEDQTQGCMNNEFLLETNNKYSVQELMNKFTKETKESPLKRKEPTKNIPLQSAKKVKAKQSHRK